MHKVNLANKLGEGCRSRAAGGLEAFTSLNGVPLQLLRKCLVLSKNLNDFNAGYELANMQGFAFYPQTFHLEMMAEFITQTSNSQA
jgi:hypothetical protein